MGGGISDAAGAIHTDSGWICDKCTQILTHTYTGHGVSGSTPAVCTEYDILTSQQGSELTDSSKVLQVSPTLQSLTV